MNSIYLILKDVLNNENFNLTEKLKSIQYYQVHGELTLEQMEELKTLAREKAKPQYNVNEDLTTILVEINNLKKRVEALENNTSEPTIPAENEYPDYQVGKWYYKDDKITYNNKKWICIAPEGQVCTWNPDEYPNYWQEVQEQ